MIHKSAAHPHNTKNGNGCLAGRREETCLWLPVPRVVFAKRIMNPAAIVKQPSLFLSRSQFSTNYSTLSNAIESSPSRPKQNLKTSEKHIYDHLQ